MRTLNRDSLPHLVYWFSRMASTPCHNFRARLYARWWGVQLGRGGTFVGQPRFYRHPDSRIFIGTNCKFNSSHASNWIGVNRPCLISTLKEGAVLSIGSGCGFSGAVVACAHNISIGHNVRCGANTLITDTDWHADDSRAGPDNPVKICDNVWLGVNVTVLKGVVIGEGTLVGVGSIVTASLPPRVVAVGVPARVIRLLDHLGSAAETDKLT